MIEALISLLIVLIVIGVIWWIGGLILAQIASPLPLAMIWNVICALICFIILIKFVLYPVLSGMHPI